MFAGTFFSWEAHRGSRVPLPTVSPALREGMEVGTPTAADGCHHSDVTCFQEQPSD